MGTKVPNRSVWYYRTPRVTCQGPSGRHTPARARPRDVPSRPHHFSLSLIIITSQNHSSSSASVHSRRRASMATATAIPPQCWRGLSARAPPPLSSPLRPCPVAAPFYPLRRRIATATARGRRAALACSPRYRNPSRLNPPPGFSAVQPHLSRPLVGFLVRFLLCAVLVQVRPGNGRPWLRPSGAVRGGV
jgi:hypothetical protein